ncbi:MAG: rRNA cytosine-C5-methyltransferase [Streptosporangiales bacterium]|nr:rRNA cytosine-C5-methyltransferase [Streptosporangiales bacterium]
MSVSARRPTGRPGGRTGNQRRPRDLARRTAFDVLHAVDARGAYANLLLPSLLRDRHLDPRDAALATELTYGALRGRGTYDAVLALCSDRPLAEIDPPLRDVLRLGAHQLLATRIPPHAAVSATVDLARRVTGDGPARFANAVLRRVAARDLDAWMEIAAPPETDDPIGRLAILHSHPRWVVEALRDALAAAPAQPDTAPAQPGAASTQPGAAPTRPEAANTQPGAASAQSGDASALLGAGGELAALLAADNERPRVTLAAKPGRSDRNELVAGGAEPARYSPHGAYLIEGDPAQVLAVKQRRATVQDEASQLIAAALAGLGRRRDGERWLDMCAGPGGKSALLSGLARDGGARLLAADAQEHRAGLVARAVARSGTARAVVADGTRPAWRSGAFDRVLVDAPCTGLGALRRRPEARWRRGPDSVPELAALQRRLLDAAVDAARPDGVIAYVTCTPVLAETREVVDAVRADRPDLEVLDAPAALRDVAVGDLDLGDGPYAQFWPHRHGTDAMFCALLRRTA